MSRKISQIAAGVLRVITRGSRKVFLGPGESILILRMAVWVSILSILVKLRPLPRALRMVAAKRPGDAKPPESETAKKLARAADLLLGTDLLIFKPICWKRAAILHRYLALNGIATRIVFGVRRAADGAVNGHAWLESDGKPLLETTVPDYVVTYTFPSNEPFNIELGLLTKDTL